MEVTIRKCAACGAVVMGDESSCSACGQAMPDVAPAQSPSPPPRAKTAEVTCAKCGAKVPKSVLRCRDCGAYMSVEIEAAMLAKQMSRGAGGSARPGMAPPLPGNVTPPGSGFSEVADDADFDLDVDLKMVDLPLEETQGRGGQSVAEDVEDDFEMGDGSAAEEYGVAGSDEYIPALAEESPPAKDAAGKSTPEPAADKTDEPPVGSAPEAPEAPTDKAGPETGVAHSVQTAGDVLLDAALAEERAAGSRGRGSNRRLSRSASIATSPDKVLVFCPNGHRIQVHSKHRGRTGRCPNCKALYFVPVADTEQTLGQAGGTDEAAATGEATPADVTQQTGYTQWITGLYLHRLNPAKLKLKPGSLVGEHEVADLGACAEHLLLAVLFAGGGAFRSMQEPKKTAANRQKMLEHLASKMPVPDLPIPKHYVLTSEALQQLKIVQPTLPGEESLFADVPVFGEGRIAIRIPAADAAGERTYLSFTLTQFRTFSAILADAFGVTEFGAGTLIPLTDDFQESTCHYSEAILRSLPTDKLVFYRADPTIKLVPVGRKCQKCGLIVSEDSRKKEKIGGKSDSSVAKAKCPKCKQKFGDITLYGFPQEAAQLGTGAS